MTSPTQEILLSIWLDREADDRSPYGLYGFPPMWKTLEVDGVTLFTRPGRTQRHYPGIGYREEDGVHYQWKVNDTWVGQGYQATFDCFAENFDRIVGQAVALHGVTGITPDPIPDLLVTLPVAPGLTLNPEAETACEEAPQP